MHTIIPKYYAPDFQAKKFLDAPDVRFEKVPMDGVAPENFHSTSMFPEYFKVSGTWQLATESRMDSSVGIVTNVQDFITLIAKDLGVMD